MTPHNAICARASLANVTFPLVSELTTRCSTTRGSLLRMTDAHDAGGAAGSSAGRELARARWGSTAVERAAAVVLARAAELPDTVREQVHEATGDQVPDD